jgi:hypothetical protein
MITDVKPSDTSPTRLRSSAEAVSRRRPVDRCTQARACGNVVGTSRDLRRARSLNSGARGFGPALSMLMLLQSTKLLKLSFDPRFCCRQALLIREERLGLGFGPSRDPLPRFSDSLKGRVEPSHTHFRVTIVKISMRKVARTVSQRCIKEAHRSATALSSKSRMPLPRPR